MKTLITAIILAFLASTSYAITITPSGNTVGVTMTTGPKGEQGNSGPWVDVLTEGVKGDGTTADDEALDAAVARMVPYQTLYLPGQHTYKLTRAHVWDIPRGSKIVCDGTLRFYGNVAGITLSGFQVDTRISNIISNDNSTQTGLTLLNTYDSDIYVQNVENFQTGVSGIGSVTPSSAGITGTAVNRVTIRNIATPRSNGVCLYLNTNGAGYVNENIWNLGQMTGQRGIYTVKGTGQVDPFNGNKFMFPDFENIYGSGTVSYEVNFGKANLLFHPRFEGNHLSDYWIVESSDSSRNVYELTGFIDYNRLQLNGTMRTWIGDIIDSDFDVVSKLQLGAPQAGMPDINIAHSKRTNTMNNTLFFGNAEPGNSVWTHWAGGVKDGNGVYRKWGQLDPLGYYNAGSVSGNVTVPDAVSYISCSTDAASGTLLMPAIKEISGATIWLEVVSYANTLTIKNSSGNVDATVSTPGLKLLKWTGTAWQIKSVAPSPAVTTSLLKGDGAGGFSVAGYGTDYLPPAYSVADSSPNVEIDVTTPTAQRFPANLVRYYNNGFTGGYPGFQLINSGGTAATPAPSQSGLTLGKYSWRGQGTTGQKVGAALAAVAEGAFTDANQPTSLQVQLGTTGGNGSQSTVATFGSNGSLTVTGSVTAGGGSAGKAVCWKADGKTLGWRNAADADGTCN